MESRRFPFRRLVALAFALFPLALFAARAAGPSLHLRSPDPIEAIAFSGDGATMALASLQRIQLYDAASATATGSLGAPRCLLGGLVVAGRHLSVTRQHCYTSRAGEPGVVRIWHSGGGLQGLLRYHDARLQAINIDEERGLVGAVGMDGVFRSWPLAGGAWIEERQLLSGNREQRRFLTPYALSADLRVAAIRDWRERYMVLIQTSDGAVLQRSEYPYQDDQPLFCFAPDNHSYFDGRRVRNLNDGAASYELAGENGLALTIARFSADSRLLAVAAAHVPARPGARRFSPERSERFRIEIHDWQQRRRVAQFDLSGQVRALSFSPDNAALFAGAFGGELWRYSIAQ